jgi:hypothetical protein
MITPQTEKIVKALDTLCDACEIGRSESSTERLYLILASAFSCENVLQMNAILNKSHDEGLCYDMRWPIAQKVAEQL